MDRFLQLQDDDNDDDKFDLSAIAGHRSSELSWDLMGSPQSTLLWSPMGSSYQGSSEASSQEASPPPTPRTCTLLEDERFSYSRQHHPNHHHHEILRSFNPSINIGPSSHQSLIQDQIRSIELSRLKQEQGRLLKQELDANGESEETSVGRRAGPGPPPMRAVLLGGSASRGGTGVFLPRSAPPQSTQKQGKGCSRVIIPARVVQALQQHFDQMAATSGPNAAAAFPPLHDVLVSNRDGMYLLQKGKSRKSQANEMSLPPEWTY